MLFAGVIRISKTCVLSSWKLLSPHIYICTFDYVVLQWSVRHLAAASETTMSFAAPIPLFLRFRTPPLDGVSVHVQTILRITPAPFHDTDDASYIIFMYY